MILIAYVWIALRLIRQQDGPRQPSDRLLPRHGENHPYKAPGEEPIRQRRHPRAAARSERVREWVLTLGEQSVRRFMN